MKRLILAALTFCLMQTGAFADNDRTVSVQQLPAKAQTFIKKHFPKSGVSYAVQESNFLGKEYKVIFTNGAKVEFDKKGEWTNVEDKTAGVPRAIVPAAIQKQVSQRHPKQKIVEIERERSQYKVELSNKLELVFNKNFKLVGVDD